MKAVSQGAALGSLRRLLCRNFHRSPALYNASAHDDWLAARRTERALEMKALSQYQRDYDEAAAVAEEEDEFSWTKLGLAKAKMGDDRTDEYVVEGSNDETPTRALFLDEKTSKSPEWFTDDELTDDDEDNDEANSGFYTDEEELSPAEAARRVAPAQASAQAVDMKPAHSKLADGLFDNNDDLQNDWDTLKKLGYGSGPKLEPGLPDATATDATRKVMWLLNKVEPEVWNDKRLAVEFLIPLERVRAILLLVQSDHEFDREGKFTDLDYFCDIDIPLAPHLYDNNFIHERTMESMYKDNSAALDNLNLHDPYLRRIPGDEGFDDGWQVGGVPEDRQNMNNDLPRDDLRHPYFQYHMVPPHIADGEEYLQEREAAKVSVLNKLRAPKDQQPLPYAGLPSPTSEPREPAATIGDGSSWSKPTHRRTSPRWGRGESGMRLKSANIDVHADSPKTVITEIGRGIDESNRTMLVLDAGSKDSRAATEEEFEQRARGMRSTKSTLREMNDKFNKTID